MAKKQTKRERDAQITRVAKRAIEGLQINIMDLSKIHDSAVSALSSHGSILQPTEDEAIAVVREYALTIAYVEPMKRHG